MLNNVFRVISTFSIVATLLFATGCTQKASDVQATVAEAYSNYVDVTLSKKEIQDIPYASAYLKIGTQKQVFVVLAFAETNPLNGAEQLKWVSADKAMIVTENGRIVKTLGLMGDNLIGVEGELPSVVDMRATSISVNYSWMPGYRYDFPAVLSSSKQGQELVTTPIYSIDTQVINERIVFPSINKYITNTYWVDSSGQVKKSRQYLGPDMVAVEMTILKPFKSKQEVSK
ncbi:Regulator [Vibrio rotiferianus]|uniref:YjbF family lipoprotein n=1 Tax=Vibrio rotiferianus TaxID=190895 RepID=UPI00289610DC|nr:Regulator [Vibrio rotiferianus]